MIAYFDTSAFVPLLIVEPSSERCRRLWDAADLVISTRALFAEAAAAVARAERDGRIAPDEMDSVLPALDEHWREMRKVEVSDRVVRAAAAHARLFALRGYDAVHCASAQLLAADELVAASGDRSLVAAWKALGLRTFDPNRLS